VAVFLLPDAGEPGDDLGAGQRAAGRSPRAGGQRIDHRADLFMLFAKEMADLVLQDGEQVLLTTAAW